jgi:microcystin-dependent protein
MNAYNTMAEPFLGEIRAFGFNWPAEGWALCDGTLLSIRQNAALYSLLGTAFGGDGVNTFALPDLRGRTPIHPNPSQSLIQGKQGGVEQVTLSQNQVPVHSHTVVASSTPSDRSFVSGECYLGATVGGSSYARP